MTHDQDTIAAPATASGGALSIIRVSGRDALAVCDRVFRGRKPLAGAKGYTVHYGTIADGERTLDDVLVTVFRAPHSYTGDDSVEISCHGSQYIISELLRLLSTAGARMAAPGEFTTRAYLAGKLDLAQAEAVADMIASSSQAAHALASMQMRGSYSAALDTLRGELLNLASLLELELDFGEEEVEFADRTQLRDTMLRIAERIDSLRDSFSLGNAIKEGVAVAITGAPNVGKSTLLNRLLGEDRALVSEIPGTTRDTIEERTNIDGVVFRFIDTAGIRTTDDQLEQMGIERTLSSIGRAQIVLRMYDAAQITPGSAPPATRLYPDRSDEHTGARRCIVPIRTPDTTPTLRPDQKELLVVNKLDEHPSYTLPVGAIGISAKNGTGIDLLRNALRASVDTQALYHGDTVVSHSRHFEALTAARTSLTQALCGLRNGLSTDLLSEEIRQVIHHLGTITGQIATEEILKTIFSKFCIGK